MSRPLCPPFPQFPKSFRFLSRFSGCAQYEHLWLMSRLLKTEFVPKRGLERPECPAQIQATGGDLKHPGTRAAESGTQWRMTMTLLSTLPVAAFVAIAVTGRADAAQFVTTTETILVTHTYYCTGGFSETDESGDQHWVRKVCRPVNCTTNGCVYANEANSVVNSAAEGPVLLPVVAVTPIPPVAPSYCTHHLAESNGYLPLRIRPGTPLNNTNKVADLPNGTCGIVPTGQTVTLGPDS
jgi:hypothetical protein